jgi:flagellar P-ring protein precursor FlgI
MHNFPHTQHSAFKQSHGAPAVLAMLLLHLAVVHAICSAHHAARIKEVAAVQGVRSNQLTGFGLVVGLDGTGDQTTQMPITSQAMQNYLQQARHHPARGRHGANAAQERGHGDGHRAVAGLCPPWPGIDVNVSSMGNCQVAQGRHADCHAAARRGWRDLRPGPGQRGRGGAGASAGGSKVQVNHLSAGRVFPMAPR